jgi:ABC-type antimicrobial peptide transport system permease subunit
VFYLSYLRSELLRRKSRTILTLLGLSIGVALVIAISALSRGLDHAQKTALDPLSSIGTDLTVTLAPEQDTGGFGAVGPGGGGFMRGGGGNGQVLQANQSAITDLSKLGKAGTHFVHDFFLPGTQLTFPQSQAKQIAAIDGVSAVSSGLVMSAVHQEGTVPKIVARITAGGQRLRVTGQLRVMPTQAEREKIRECFQKLAQENSAAQTPGQGNGNQGGGANPGGGQLGPGAGGVGGAAAGPGGGRFRFSDPAAAKCLPATIRNFAKTIVTPEQTIQQLVDPPQTNIQSTSYSIAGVDPATPDIGLVTPSLLASGRFLSNSSANEALVAGSYAKQKSLKLGSKIDLNGTKLTVVGLVKPPLGGQSADVYLSLAKLQKLASQTGLTNVVLVRADSSRSVADVQKAIETQFPNAQVASAKSVAGQITGSLADASKLSDRLGVALAIIAALAAFLMAVLLTLSSIGKRVREIGTLKALGWTQRRVVRQVVGESFAQGVAGGLLGVGLGIAIAAGIGAFGPTLRATSTTGSGEDQGAFGLGALAARTITDTVSLTAPISITVLLVGFGLALAGGLLAGTAGAFRAARLRPADALRTVE